MRKKQRIFYQAFTLLELMLTVSVLALGIVPVINSMATGMVADQVIEYQMVAISLTQQKMEEIKDCWDWKSIGDYALERTKIEAPFDDYEWEVTIKDMAEDEANFKQATATVYWEIKGVEQSISLLTLLTNLTPDA